MTLYKKLFLLGISLFAGYASVFAQNKRSQAEIDATLIKVTALNQNFTPINFIGPGNDFGGGIIWLTNKKLDKPVNIEKTNGIFVTCASQIRGFYFNSQRGERLWPLDNETLQDFNGQKAYDTITLTGGRYTDCEYPNKENNKKNDDFVEYSIFGNVQYKDKGTGVDLYQLVAGISMDYANNKIPKNAKWIHSFQYINNTTPAGYIYDTAGGIGFVGGVVGRVANDVNTVNKSIKDEHEKILNGLGGIDNATKIVSINKAISQGNGGAITLFGKPVNNYAISSAVDTRLGIAVLGTIGVGHGYTDTIKRAILGNPGATSSISEVASINSSDRYNTANKNAQKLCRGAKKAVPGFNGSVYSDDVICIRGGAALSLDGNNKVILQGKNNNTFLIHKDKRKRSLYVDGDLTIQKTHKLGTDPVDIYVNGDVTINNNIATNNIVNITAQGFPTNTESATKGLYFRGNLLVNGKIKGSEAKDTMTHKLYLHGKTVSLNNIAKPSEKREKRDRIKTKNTLTSTFTRRCNPHTGTGTDGAHCDGGKAKVDNFALVPLIIIDQQYKSRFLAK